MKKDGLNNVMSSDDELKNENSDDDDGMMMGLGKESEINFVSKMQED